MIQDADDKWLKEACLSDWKPSAKVDAEFLAMLEGSNYRRAPKHGRTISARGKLEMTPARYAARIKGGQARKGINNATMFNLIIGVVVKARGMQKKLNEKRIREGLPPKVGLTQFEMKQEIEKLGVKTSIRTIRRHLKWMTVGKARK